MTNKVKAIEFRDLVVRVWDSKTVPGGIYIEVDTSDMSRDDVPILIYMNDGRVWHGTADGYPKDFPAAPGVKS